MHSCEEVGNDRCDGRSFRVEHASFVLAHSFRELCRFPAQRRCMAVSTTLFHVFKTEVLPERLDIRWSCCYLLARSMLRQPSMFSRSEALSMNGFELSVFHRTSSVCADSNQRRVASHRRSDAFKASFTCPKANRSNIDGPIE